MSARGLQHARRAAEEGREIDAFRRTLARDVLPFWVDAGYDPATGMFRERLDFSGREPADVARRAFVQARQVYVYSAAAREGVYKRGTEAAATTLRNLMQLYLDDGDARRGFAFSVDRSGARASNARDAYTQVFVLFALAAHYRLIADSSLLRAADDTLAFIDAHLWDEVHGGLFDAAPRAGDGKRQNPLMHYLEACLALHEAAPGGPYLARAREVVRLLREKLLRDNGALPEHFARDWSSDGVVGDRACFEPGHHFEWVWLLRWFEQAAGERLDDMIAGLWSTATRYGLDASGRCVDSVSLDFVTRKSSLRLWPQTEAIKASCSRGDHDMAEGMAGVVNRAFLSRPFAGGWIDRLDANGRDAVDFVPASSLYHVFCAASELSRAFDVQDARRKADAP